MNFNDELNQKVKDIENMIFSKLPEEEGPQKTVVQAMRYSVMAGGKRLRPLLKIELLSEF